MNYFHWLKLQHEGYFPMISANKISLYTKTTFISSLVVSADKQSIYLQFNINVIKTVSNTLYFSSLFEKSKSTIKTVLDLKTYNSREVGQIFLKIMKIPFNRLKDYCKLFGRLALKFPAVSIYIKSIVLYYLAKYPA